MTELEMMRWILGILITATALAVMVMYFFRSKENPIVIEEAESGDSRSVLQQRVLMSSYADNRSCIHSTILESEVYEDIQRNIRNGTIINESNHIWEELEKAITLSSPKFKSNLYILSGGDLKTSDLHMAMLIKCGVSPANIATLVGRSKSTVTFRRKDMGKKFFDQEMDANVADELIRSI